MAKNGGAQALTEWLAANGGAVELGNSSVARVKQSKSGRKIKLVLKKPKDGKNEAKKSTKTATVSKTTPRIAM